MEHAIYFCFSYRCVPTLVWFVSCNARYLQALLRIGTAVELNEGKSSASHFYIESGSVLFLVLIVLKISFVFGVILQWTYSCAK